MPITAPTALELKSVEIKHHDASAEIIVRRVKLMSRFIEPDLFNSADDHRRRWWIFCTEGCDGCFAGGLCCGLGPATAAWRSEESCNRSRAAATRNVSRGWGRVAGRARRPLRCARHFAHNFAGLWIIF